MFAAAQLEQACLVLQQMVHPLDLRLDAGPDPGEKFSRALVGAVEKLALVAADKLRLVRAREAGREFPALEVANVRYRAVPFGPELEPFLELLVRLSRRSAQAGPPHLAPAHLRVLIAPTCPNCPHTVIACNRLAADHPEISLEVVDVQYYRDEAGRVTSVPAVVVDGARTLVGRLTERDLMAVLEERNDEGYLPRTIASMIETGRVSDAAPLIASPHGHRAFCALLTGSTMQQRIGLVLAAEEALAQDPHALDGAVPCLLPLLAVSDDSLRGDTADLLGRIGAPGAREALTELLQDGNPDLREVATDALSMLREPS